MLNSPMVRPAAIGNRCSLLLVAVSVALIACSPDPSARQPPASPISLIVGVPPGSHSDIGIQQLPRLLSFEALILTGRDGHPRPGLAEAWQVSADGLRWQFTLRDGVRFHDGTPLTAELVKQTLDAFLQTPPGRSAPGLQDITSIEAAGQHELAIALRAPSAFLLEDLALLTITRPGSTSIGTGVYYTSAMSPDEIVMEASPHYHRGTPTVDRIVFRAYPTLRAAWANMMRGEVDLLYEVDQEAVEFVKQESSIQVFAVLRPYAYSVVFNTRSPQLRNPAVRRALNLAIDRDHVLVQALKGRGRAAVGPIWPEHWAHDPGFEGYRHDPREAEALLPPIATAPRPDAPPARLRFTCLIQAKYSIYERLALVVQRQLLDLDVDMRIEAVPTAEFHRRAMSGAFEAILLDLAGGPSLTVPYRFWRSPSDAAPNLFGYSSTGVDTALEDIRRAAGDEAVRRGVADLQRALHEDPPGIFLAWSEVARALSREFEIGTEVGAGQEILGRLWQLRSRRQQAE
jgi:peptide/nickel transport system substrate-binding protein